MGHTADLEDPADAVDHHRASDSVESRRAREAGQSGHKRGPSSKSLSNSFFSAPNAAHLSRSRCAVMLLCGHGGSSLVFCTLCFFRRRDTTGWGAGVLGCGAVRGVYARRVGSRDDPTPIKHHRNMLAPPYRKFIHTSRRTTLPRELRFSDAIAIAHVAPIRA